MTSATAELALRQTLKKSGEYWKYRGDAFIWKGEEIYCNFGDILEILGQAWLDSIDADEYAVSPPHAEIPNVVNYDGPIDLKAEILKAQAAEPMIQLRLERDLKLEESDWMAMGDRTPTKAQTDYRQALRDIPSTASPTLSATGWLDDDSFDWPTKP